MDEMSPERVERWQSGYAAGYNERKKERSDKDYAAGYARGRHDGIMDFRISLGPKKRPLFDFHARHGSSD